MPRNPFVIAFEMTYPYAVTQRPECLTVTRHRPVSQVDRKAVTLAIIITIIIPISSGICTVSINCRDQRTLLKFLWSGLQAINARALITPDLAGLCGRL
ncbi:hypothetical protein CDAR_407921 [Caerostris darwini]|uniref:Uncharacterized protein n=1 Tax=Caerostris darwini TaxID=1538125 RepID=A0AAV4PW65_9ARAC|nr:hypothetical protein CDAR_407921 [Caerostris darwini]